MKLNRLTLLAFFGAATAGFIAACTFPQPLPECAVASGSPVFGTTNMFAKYTLKSGTGPCAELTGEEVGFQHYRAPNSREGTVAIRPERIGALAAERKFPTNAGNANAIGNWSYQPDTDGLCYATDVQPAEQNVPALVVPLADGGSNTLPATLLRYEWSNVQVVNTANFPGTAFKAELRYTEDNCTATYDVQGIWPLVHCSTNAECDPAPDLDAGRVTGSGLNPDFRPVCDATTEVCLSSRPFSELR